MLLVARCSPLLVICSLFKRWRVILLRTCSTPHSASAAWLCGRLRGRAVAFQQTVRSAVRSCGLFLVRPVSVTEFTTDILYIYIYSYTSVEFTEATSASMMALNGHRQCYVWYGSIKDMSWDWSSFLLSSTSPTLLCPTSNRWGH